MTLFNQWWTEHDGSAIGNVPSPKLVVHTDTPGLTLSEGQQGFVRNAYAKFCTSVATSCFPKGYHRQEYSAADGTKVVAESINGTHKAQVWISGGAEEKLEEGIYLNVLSPGPRNRVFVKYWVLWVSPDLKRSKIVYTGTFPEALLTTPELHGGGFPFGTAAVPEGTVPQTIVGRQVVFLETVPTGYDVGHLETVSKSQSFEVPGFAQVRENDSVPWETVPATATLNVTYSEGYSVRSARLNGKILRTEKTVVSEVSTTHTYPPTVGDFSISVRSELSSPTASHWITVDFTSPDATGELKNIAMSGGHQDYVFLREEHTTYPFRPYHEHFPQSTWQPGVPAILPSVSGFVHNEHVTGIGLATAGTLPVGLSRFPILPQMTRPIVSPASEKFWHIDKTLKKAAVSADDIIAIAGEWHHPRLTVGQNSWGAQPNPYTSESESVFGFRGVAGGVGDRAAVAVNMLQFLSHDKTHICWPVRAVPGQTTSRVGVRFEKKGSEAKADMLSPVNGAPEYRWWWNVWRWQPQTGVVTDVVGLKDSFVAIAGYPGGSMGGRSDTIMVPMLYRARYGDDGTIAEVPLRDILPDGVPADAVVSPWGNVPTRLSPLDNKFLLYRGPP